MVVGRLAASIASALIAVDALGRTHPAKRSGRGGEQVVVRHLALGLRSGREQVELVLGVPDQQRHALGLDARPDPCFGVETQRVAVGDRTKSRPTESAAG